MITEKVSKIITGIVAILLVSYMVAVNAQEYKRYCNNRYGFCVKYPSYFGIEPAPDNGDGRRFYDRDGFVMIAYGSMNVFNDTLQSEMRSQSQDFDKITYRFKRQNWYVLSGYKGSNILYLKTYVGNVANYLYIEYPAHQKAKYNGIAAKISRSFKPGNLN